MYDPNVEVGSELPNGSRFAADYEIELMEGSFTRTITTIEETTTSRIINGVEKLQIIRKMKPVKEEFHKGYMIYYPQAHSIFVAADDKAQLKQLGVIDHEDDEPVLRRAVVIDGSGLTAKEAVIKSEGRKRRSTVGGIEEAMRG